MFTTFLQGNDARLYEFIVRHFLACCSQDAQGQETIIEVDINEEVVSAKKSDRVSVRKWTERIWTTCCDFVWLFGGFEVNRSQVVAIYFCGVSVHAFRTDDLGEKLLGSLSVRKVE